MEIVSMGKKPPKSTVPQAPQITLTPDAVTLVQSRGQLEYNMAVNALQNLVNTMSKTVLFGDIANTLGQQVQEAFRIQLSMLDPMMATKQPNKTLTEQVKDAQRKLFLEFAERYGLEGIKKE